MFTWPVNRVTDARVRFGVTKPSQVCTVLPLKGARLMVAPAALLSAAAGLNIHRLSASQYTATKALSVARALPFPLLSVQLTVSLPASVEAACAYAGQDLPRQEVRADCTRQGERQWFIEVTLPRVRDYTFSITATDDRGQRTEPLRVVVSP